MALTWGWIDSHKRPFDETASLQRFGPRVKRSPWSKINVDKAEALIAAGKMKPPGLAEVERAKADGRWDRAYYSQKNATVPEDLAAALLAAPKAARFFATLDATNRSAILYRIRSVKKADGEDNQWDGGHILDPEDGKTYKVRLTPADGGKKLDVRGYIGAPLLGRTQTWIRVE